MITRYEEKPPRGKLYAVRHFVTPLTAESRELPQRYETFTAASKARQEIDPRLGAFITIVEKGE